MCVCVMIVQDRIRNTDPISFVTNEILSHSSLVFLFVVLDITLLSVVVTSNHRPFPEKEHFSLSQ